MSDPQTMLNYPGTVADHFVAALGKIEQLQVFLTAPHDHCANRHWVGNDILNGGIKSMVNIVLVKHMEPLRWKHPKYFIKNATKPVVEGQRTAAPPVFAQEFKQPGHTPCHETEIAREIKENNCMAALVLLYYYLYWHVLLISLNQNLHPCIGGQSTNDKPDIDGMLKNLPAFFDTLELRPMRIHLKMDYSRDVDGESLSECSSDGDGSGDDDDDEMNKRRGPTIAAGIIRKGRNARNDIEGEGARRRPREGDAIEEDDAGDRDRGDQRGTAGARTTTRRVIHGKMRQLMERYTASGAADGFMLSLPDEYCAQEDAGNQERGPPVVNPRLVAKNVRRSSKLINLYRVVLASTSTSKKADVLLQYAHALGYAGREGDLGPGYAASLAVGKDKEAVQKHLDGRVLESRDQSMIDSLMFNFHTFSVLDVQDSVQRWYDMCKPFEVKSLGTADIADNIDCVQKKYTCILAEVLKHDPLNMLRNPERKARLERACIHDFNSASLMMDICASFLKLHAVVLELRSSLHTDDRVKKQLMVFMMQTYSSDMAMRKMMSVKIRDAIPASVSSYLQSGVIAAPVGNFRKPAIMTAAQYADGPELNIFELAGHYWGSKQADMHSVNHAYFAWPYAEHENYDKVIRLVQNLIHINGNEASIIPRYRLILSTGLRNSLYISSVTNAMLKLIDALHCTPLLDGMPVKIREDDLIHRTKQSVIDLPEHDSAALLRDNGDHFMGLERIRSPGVYNTMTIKRIISELRTEQYALSVRVNRALKGEFKLYTGISWPGSVVQDGRGPVHNYAAFQLAGEMPLATRTRHEYYLSRLATAADLMISLGTGAAAEAAIRNARGAAAEEAAGRVV
jgi:hypothetical protein